MDHCILFAHPDTNVPKNLYVEMITRAINFLDIIVLPVKNKRNQTLIKVFEKWQNNNLVSTTHTEIITKSNAGCIQFENAGTKTTEYLMDANCKQNKSDMQLQLQEELNSFATDGSSLQLAVK